MRLLNRLNFSFALLESSNFDDIFGTSLPQRIREFIDKYAALSPNWDKEELDGKYTGPDPYQLLGCANLIEAGKKPVRCWSEWGSGCYKPYSSKEGREEHDLLVKEVCNIINESKEILDLDKPVSLSIPESLFNLGVNDIHAEFSEPEDDFSGEIKGSFVDGKTFSFILQKDGVYHLELKDKTGLIVYQEDADLKTSENIITILHDRLVHAMSSNISEDHSDNQNNESNILNIPDGTYTGSIKGWDVYIDSINSSFKTWKVGLKNSFPIKCEVTVKNNLAVVKCTSRGIKFNDIYSSEEAYNFFNKDLVNESFNTLFGTSSWEIPDIKDIKLLKFSGVDNSTKLTSIDQIQGNCFVFIEGKNFLEIFTVCAIFKGDKQYWVIVKEHHNKTVGGPWISIDQSHFLEQFDKIYYKGIKNKYNSNNLPARLKEQIIARGFKDIDESFNTLFGTSSWKLPEIEDEELLKYNNFTTALELTSIDQLQGSPLIFNQKEKTIMIVAGLVNDEFIIITDGDNFFKIKDFSHYNRIYYTNKYDFSNSSLFLENGVVRNKLRMLLSSLDVDINESLDDLFGYEEFKDEIEVFVKLFFKVQKLTEQALLTVDEWNDFRIIKEVWMINSNEDSIKHILIYIKQHPHEIEQVNKNIKILKDILKKHNINESFDDLFGNTIEGSFEGYTKEVTDLFNGLSIDLIYMKFKRKKILDDLAEKLKTEFDLEDCFVINVYNAIVVYPKFMVKKELHYLYEEFITAAETGYKIISNFNQNSAAIFLDNHTLLDNFSTIYNIIKETNQKTFYRNLEDYLLRIKEHYRNKFKKYINDIRNT